MMAQAQGESRPAAPSEYLRNAWYQAAWSIEVGDAPLARTLLDTPVVLFRGPDGVAALLDRCPHRFAPLSTGCVRDGAITCGYHGLAFDGGGRCVRNPHGPITSGMRAAPFPVVERHTAVWIWPGDPERAHPALIPDLSFIDETPEVARIALYMPTCAGYQLLTDNIMDLSHADYLHASSLGGVITDAKTRVFERDGALVAEWTNPGCQAPGMFQQRYPSPQPIDYWIEVAWRAPAVMVLGTAVVAQGAERGWGDHIYALHNMTPETATSTHYFMCATRREQTDNAGFSAMLKGALEHAFLGEDKPMVEAQQSRIGCSDFLSLGPALLRIDAASTRVRRELDRRIGAEHADANHHAAATAA